MNRFKIILNKLRTLLFTFDLVQICLKSLFLKNLRLAVNNGERRALKTFIFQLSTNFTKKAILYPFKIFFIIFTKKGFLH